MIEEENPLSHKQKRRVFALQKARQVISATTIMSSSIVSPDDVIQVAQYILTGEES